MTAPADCALCRPQLLTPVLRDARLWRVAVNRNQNLLGKLIVVLRRHEESVAALTADEWISLHDEVRWATERLRRAFAPDHFNYAFLQNQDRHVHLHVIPRYASSRELGGAIFGDPDYPGHYRPGVERIADESLLDALGRALG